MQAAFEGTEQARVRAERLAVADPQLGEAAADLTQDGGQVGVAVVSGREQERQHDNGALAA